MNDSVGMVEVTGSSNAIYVLDTMLKSAAVTVYIFCGSTSCNSFEYSAEIILICKTQGRRCFLNRHTTFEHIHCSSYFYMIIVFGNSHSGIS